MPVVKYRDQAGGAYEVEVPSGTTVMQGAVDNMLDGIVGECGGACSCATCHVYVDPAWAKRLPAPDEMEKDMLECVLEPGENSRLSCQITVSDELDGLEVIMPDSQF